MPSFSDVYASVKLDLDKDEENKLKRRLGKIDTKDAGRRMGAGLSKNLGGGFRAGIAGTARTMFAPIAAAAAAVGGFALFKGFIADAAESAKISRLTAQVIESTGGAANVTAEQVNKLATAISNKTGVDDEAIQSGANLLLTFKNIRNEVGKGNDIFDQANQAVTDMSVALGQDTKSSAIQLGKALNDPIRGVTALQRVGVSFTADQKEQIKTLVEAGDVMGAQKLILKELGDQFGGAAEAAADPMDKLKVIVGNLGEEIGAKMLPLVEDAATWLGENLPKALEAVSGFMRREVIPRLKEFAEFFKAEILPRLKEFGTFIRDEIVPRLVDLGGWISKNRDFFIPFVALLGAAVAGFKAFMFIKTVTLAVAAFNAMLLANPIGLVVAAIAALAAGLVYAYKNSETFRDIVDGVFDFVASAADSFWNGFLKPIFDAFGAAIEWIGDTAEDLKILWDLSWEEMKSTVRDGIRFIVDGFLGFVDTILQGAEQAFGWIPGVGDKLDDAHDAFSKFRRDVNRELDGIYDESINIDVGYAVTGSGLPAGLVRGGSGGRGGAGSGGIGPLPGIASHASEAMGGALDLNTRGLNSKQISDMATDFVGRTKTALVKAVTQAVASAPAGASGFPLPRGRYRVGRGTVGHGYPAVDFPAVTGTPVYAVRSGVVTRALRLARSYGIHAILGHPGGWGSLYAHMSRMFVRSGQFVRAGQQIGAVGSTGNSTGPHLHFEARRYGSRVNPRSLISYDSGGYLPTGVSLVHNGTGQPEPVRPADLPMELADRSLHKLGEIIARNMVAGMSAVQSGSARAAGLYSRSG